MNIGSGCLAAVTGDLTSSIIALGVGNAIATSDSILIISFNVDLFASGKALTVADAVSIGLFSELTGDSDLLVLAIILLRLNGFITSSSAFSINSNPADASIITLAAMLK